ncbi:hypothetical protein [Streptomyces sp. NPDC001135]
MSDPWDGPAGQATRSRSARVPGQRAAEPDGLISATSVNRSARLSSALV